ncbi:UDP-2,4-diacetamido-2,4,6-trideoxy-beta-L-altropyranose hydrolase [Thiosulfativibrio zosterae]|uniref:UDP-2,4-diacetamido-2,4,6-trideoxy-beta-L-altropy ranose hydrolase n=1 Tax=Thiosulfativibrio zosterae TaxID=2675053 RepID=A0A6F8PM16_9GAMM|nr:UDP-2,4-diacetamido-2,4,6-trideoxy-beta-L-altropyranose hydrolase [Thiosulfativibrio zosterae]BBP43087.1 UDP-2,4-diacetamido-2,4,6-trideoxy-beta-L-altropy ranose hydrolase [Thiosulfativibrio zosterae]
MMKVVIRVDASITIGTGHVMRCLALAAGLRLKGANVVFICRNHPSNLISMLRDKSWPVHMLDSQQNDQLASAKQTNSVLKHDKWLGVSQMQDAIECKHILKTIKPDWLIVDHYAIDQAWQMELQPYYKKLMVIDDLGDRQHLCDLLLDQNYGSTQVKYQNCVPDYCKAITGPRYALLRTEFAEWRDISLRRRSKCTQLKSLLVTMGGVDADNLTGQILKQLKSLSLKTVEEIVVIAGVHLETVKKQAVSMPIKTIVKTHVSNMAELMSKADLAIGAAGGTTWERACLGLPSIQLVIAFNQRDVAEQLEQAGVVKTADNPKDILSLIVHSEDWMLSVSQKSALLCDGLGVDRVIEQLLNLNK